MNLNNFTPELFVGVGQTGAFFTLRETYLATVPGEGDWGNAVVNGVYQGTYEVRSFHHFNLSQDPDEAIAKATEAAEKMGMRLTSTRESLTEEMRAIQRATADELAARQAYWEAQRAELEAERKAEDEQKRNMIAAGVFPFGPHRGVAFRDAPAGYLSWLMNTRDKFEADSLMRAIADAVATSCSDLLLPIPDATKTAGEAGQRLQFNNVTVIRVTGYARQSFSGYGSEWVNIVTMCSEHGVCLVCKSTSFSAEEGERLSFKATVKEHDEYKGQAQTVIQRIALCK